MTETQQLIARIRALADKLNLSPSTVGERVLGSGQALAKLEAGKTITLAKYQKAKVKLSEMEAS